MFGDTKYLEEAKKCGEAIWSRGLLKKGYGICHGTAGNAYAFLELFNVTNNQMYLYRAWKVKWTKINRLFSFISNLIDW